MLTFASIWSLGTVAFTGFFAIAFAIFFFLVVPLRVLFSAWPRRRLPLASRSRRNLTADSLAS